MGKGAKGAGRRLRYRLLAPEWQAYEQECQNWIAMLKFPASALVLRLAAWCCHLLAIGFSISTLFTDTWRLDNYDVVQAIFTSVDGTIPVNALGSLMQMSVASGVAACDQKFQYSYSCKLQPTNDNFNKLPFSNLLISTIVFLSIGLAANVVSMLCTAVLSWPHSSVGSSSLSDPWRLKWAESVRILAVTSAVCQLISVIILAAVLPARFRALYADVAGSKDLEAGPAIPIMCLNLIIISLLFVLMFFYVKWMGFHNAQYLFPPHPVKPTRPTYLSPFSARALSSRSESALRLHSGEYSAS